MQNRKCYSYSERTYEKLDVKKGGVEPGKAMAEKSKGLPSVDDRPSATRK